MLQNVELVIHDPAVHSPLGNAVSKWAPHIHARRLDALSLGFTQLRSKQLIERFLLGILPEPRRLAGLQVADHGGELVSGIVVQHQMDSQVGRNDTLGETISPGLRKSTGLGNALAVVPSD
jgi:hypothetical protein